MLRLYFCDSDNFGDALNKYIFEMCFGIKTEFAPTWQADAIGIGSILDRCLLQVRDIIPYLDSKIFNNKKPLYILSSGFGEKTIHYTKKWRFFRSAIIKRNLEIISLRGHLTESQMKVLCKDNFDKNYVLGDLGLLASMLVEDVPYEPIYDIGICPHYADKQNLIIKRIQEKNPNSIVLDTSENPIEYLKKMKKCKTILSTGLHPLIAADSLGIPNMWGRVSEYTTIYKYKDYYSVLDVNIEPHYLADMEITPDLILDNYIVDKKVVDKVKQDLYNKHKEFFAKSTF